MTEQNQPEQLPEPEQPLEALLTGVTPAAPSTEPETAEKVAEGLAKVKKLELNSLADALILLSAAVAEVKALTADLKAGLLEVGQQKEELAYAIADLEKSEAECLQKIADLKAGQPPENTTPPGTPPAAVKKKTKLF